MKNILVFNQARMGDLLESSPLLHKIRRVHPRSKITLAVLPEFVTIAQWLPEVDEVLPFNDAGILNQLLQSTDWVDAYAKLSAFVEDWRKRNFDLAYNLVYSRAGALFLSAIGVKEIHGLKLEPGFFFAVRDRWSAYLWNFCQFIGYNPFNITDMFRLCGEIDPGPGQYGIRPEIRNDKAGERWIAEHGLTGARFVAIQPGSNSPDRRIDPAVYAKSGDFAVAQGFRVVVLGSPKEQPLVSEVIAHMHTPGIPGICSLVELCGILDQSALLLTNDTGTMHLAAALNVPILLVCSGISNPAVSGPYKEGAFALSPRLLCQPCRPTQVCASMHCRGAISAETISQAMLWMANGRPESERPGPFADAVMRRLGRTSSGFLQVEDLEQRPLGSVEYARELWGDFWLYFAGYKNQVMQTEPNHRTYSPDAEQEIRQLKHELANWGQGLIEASKRLAAVLTGSGTELLATTKNVLSGLALLGQAGKCRHLLPYRIMLNHMQEHLFDPDPKKSVQELARLFNEYGEGMLWISMRR